MEKWKKKSHLKRSFGTLYKKHFKNQLNWRDAFAAYPNVLLTCINPLNSTLAEQFYFQEENTGNIGCGVSSSRLQN